MHEKYWIKIWTNRQIYGYNLEQVWIFVLPRRARNLYHI